MQIERVTAWAYDGHNYPTEMAAIEANLKSIGVRITKHHSSSPVSGLLEYRDELAPLLIRHAELSKPKDAEPPILKEGTQDESLEGTRAEGTRDSYDRRAEIIGQMQAMGEHAKSWLISNGFENVIEFRDRATADDMDRWDRHLAGEPEPTA